MRFFAKKKILTILTACVAILGVVVSGVSTLAWFQVQMTQPKTIDNPSGVTTGDSSLAIDSVKGYKYAWDETGNETALTAGHGGVISSYEETTPTKANGFGNEARDETGVVDTPTAGAGFYLMVEQTGNKYTYAHSLKMEDRHYDNIAYLRVTLTATKNYRIRNHTYAAGVTTDTYMTSYSISAEMADYITYSNGTATFTINTTGQYDLYVNRNNQIAIANYKASPDSGVPSLASLADVSNKQQDVEKKVRRNAAITTDRYRLYVNCDWGFSSVYMKDSGNWYAMGTSISASGNNPASGTSVVATHCNVGDYVGVGGNTYSKFTFYQNYNYTRWLPGGQSLDGSSLTGATFNNGAIYLLTGIGHKNDWNDKQTDNISISGRTNNSGGSDSYASWNLTVKEFNYTAPYVVGYFVHYQGEGISTSHYEGKTAYTTISAPSRTGYTFQGWRNSADGKLYGAGKSVTLTQETTFTAEWEGKNTTVTLDNQGATSAGTTSITAKYGSAMPTADVTMPTKTGYTFLGYYQGKGGSNTQYYTNAGASSTSWNVDAETATIYANWKPNSTARYILIGSGFKYDGTNFSDVDWYLSQSVISETPESGYSGKWTIAIRNGASFKIAWWDGSSIKWDTNQTTGLTGNAESIGFRVDTTDQNNIKTTTDATYTYTIRVRTTDKKVFISKNVSVTIKKYVRNSETTVRTDTSINTDSTYVPTVPVEPGYDFDSWHVESHSGNEWDGTFTGDFTLCATYTPKVLDISLDNKDADIAGTEDIYLRYDDDFYTTNACASSISSITIPEKAGYLFDGYWTSDDEGEDDFDVMYIDTDGTISAANNQFSEDTTLYAKWREVPTREVQISITPTGYGSVLDNGTPLEENINVPVNSVITINESTHALTFTNTGLGYTRTLTVAPLVPSPDDGYTYSFYSWSVSHNSTIPSGDGAFAITLTFTRSANTYTVTLNNQGADQDHGGASSVTGTFASSMPSIAANLPQKTGYDFQGYYGSTGGGGTQYYSSSGASTHNWDVAAATTLYAYWTPKVFEITLDGGIATSAGTTKIYAKYNTGYYLDSSCTQKMTTSAINITAPTNTNYTFAGYFTATAGGGSARITQNNSKWYIWTNSVPLLTASETWHAKWTVSVTLDRQEGTTGDTSVTVTYGAAMPSATMPTRANYTFGGYYLQTGGAGKNYYTSGGASANVWNETSNFTLYAKWTAKVYTITLNNQSATTAGTETIYENYGIRYASDIGGSPAITSITAPEKTGYTFGGYYTSTGGGGTQIIDASGVIVEETYTQFTSSVSIYAKWLFTITVQVAYTEGGNLKYRSPADANAQAGSLVVTVVESTNVTPANITTWENTINSSTPIDTTNYTESSNRYLTLSGTPQTFSNAKSASSNIATSELVANKMIYLVFQPKYITISYQHELYKRDVRSNGAYTKIGDTISNETFASTYYYGDVFTPVTPTAATLKYGSATDHGVYDLTWDDCYYLYDGETEYTNRRIYGTDNDNILTIKLYGTYETIYVVNSVTGSNPEDWHTYVNGMGLHVTTSGVQGSTDIDLVYQNPSSGYDEISWFEMSNTTSISFQIYGKETSSSNNTRYTLIITNTSKGAHYNAIRVLNETGDGLHRRYDWYIYYGKGTTTSASAPAVISATLFFKTGSRVSQIELHRGNVYNNIFVSEEGTELNAGDSFALRIYDSSGYTWYGNPNVRDDSAGYIVAEGGGTATVGDANNTTSSTVLVKLTEAGNYTFYITVKGGDNKLIAIASIPEGGEGSYIMPYDTTGTYGNKNYGSYANGIKMKSTNIEGNGNVAFYKNFIVTANNTSKQFYIKKYVNGVDDGPIKTLGDSSKQYVTFDSTTGVFTFSDTGTYTIYLRRSGSAHSIHIIKEKISGFYTMNEVNSNLHEDLSTIKAKNTSMVLEIAFRSTSKNTAVQMGVDIMRTNGTGSANVKLSKYLKFNVLYSANRLGGVEELTSIQRNTAIYDGMRDTTIYDAMQSFSDSNAVLSIYDTAEGHTVGDGSVHYLYLIMDYNVDAATLLSNRDKLINDFKIVLKARS